MLKQIHSATHPGAVLKRSPSDDQQAKLFQTQMWTGEPPSAEQLFDTLNAESDEEDAE